MARLVSTPLLALLAAREASAWLVGHTQLSGISEENWITAFKTPNATDGISFPGIDISKPYPGEPSDDWKFIIKVRDNVPRDDLFTSATWIQMQVPPNLLNKTVVDNATTSDDFMSEKPFMDVDPSWNLCMQTSFVHGLKLKEKPKNPGRCDGILSDECLEHIHASFQGYRMDGEKPDCPSWQMPEVCNKQFEDLKGYNGHGAEGVKEFGINPGADMNREGLMDFERTAQMGDVHKPDNLTAYNDLRQQVYIVSHTWGYSNTSNESARGEPVKTELFCLRANNVEGGAMRLNFAQSLWWIVLLSSAFLLEFA